MLMDLSKLAFSISEVIVSTSIHRTKIYEQIKLGHLRTLKVGRRTIVPREALMAWLNSLATDPQGE
jgi:excisionase family DNA binding protein